MDKDEGTFRFLFLWEPVERLRYRRAFGEAIRAYRKKAGLTREKLAERADMHHNFIGEVERGNMPEEDKTLFHNSVSES